jgi:site-specific recombinase XerD
MESQIKNLINDYLESIRLCMSKQTIYGKQWILEHFIRFIANANLKYYNVTKQNVEEYLSSAVHCTLGTRQYRVTTIRDFYAFLKKHDPICALMKNPAYDIRFKKYKKRSLPHVPGETSVKKRIEDPYLNAENEHEFTTLRDCALIELAYGSGLRRGELAALDIGDIDYENLQAYVRGKGSKERNVPLTESSVEAIKRYLAHRKATRGPLFISVRGKRLNVGSITWLLRTKYGIRPHLLRHACATHLLKHGCDIRHIQELLGHQDLTTTQVYTHINNADLDVAVKRLHPRSGFNELPKS